MSKRFVVVLADGETWTEMEGCTVLEVTHHEVEYLCPSNAKDFTPTRKYRIEKSVLGDFPVVAYIAADNVKE